MSGVPLRTNTINFIKILNGLNLDIIQKHINNPSGSEIINVKTKRAKVTINPFESSKIIFQNITTPVMY